MSASWLSLRSIFERPSNGFEGFLDLQASLSTRRWSVSQEPLEPHIGTQNRSKIDPKIKQARDPQRIPFGIASGRLLDRILVHLGPNLGAMLGPSWPHVRPKEGSTVKDTPLLCYMRDKLPSGGPLGPLLGLSWYLFGTLVEVSRDSFGPFWDRLGTRIGGICYVLVK